MDTSPNSGTQQETRIFVSYAREDAKWLDREYKYSLIPFLMDSLKRQNVSFWFDKELKGGDVFEQHIAAVIDNSQIALLIVSQCFLNSEFIENKEMPRIAERAKQGKMIVVPVLVEPCDWNDYPFLADRQMVPGPAPLIEYTESEAQWAKIKFQILDGLKTQVKRMRAGPQAVQVQLPAQTNKKVIPPSTTIEEPLKAAPSPLRPDASEEAKGYWLLAEKGDAEAQCRLGFLYGEGLGIVQDAVEEVRLYRKAADQGYEKAQYNLGVCYEAGEGVTQDKVEAVRWYRKAAAQEFAPAQRSLGQCYEDGDGVMQDKAEAKRWYREAAKQGDYWAKEGLKRLRRE